MAQYKNTAHYNVETKQPTLEELIRLLQHTTERLNNRKIPVRKKSKTNKSIEVGLAAMDIIIKNYNIQEQEIIIGNSTLLMNKRASLIMIIITSLLKQTSTRKANLYSIS